MAYRLTHFLVLPFNWENEVSGRPNAVSRFALRDREAEAFLVAFSVATEKPLVCCSTPQTIQTEQYGIRGD